ncbi:hypothetical protein BC834DRAFT_1017379 [Gloeopeniophorella convolvens]|nr:hypothetical protein BC834DRAFT_1017379 [Gloeopeniophorella convolvens]
MDPGSPRRPQRQDTFDLRGQMVTDEQSQLVQVHGETYPSDEEHSVLEDDSDQDERDGDYAEEDDRSSSLSIPNESIDFDLVYSLHSFAATVEGQASVVKGDSLVLMDDSNSYWWLVRVLKTQEIGYIPAENIETPFERLARLNKHRNVDLASATQAEMQDGLQESRDHFRNNMSSRAGSSQQTPSPTPGNDPRVAARSRQHARRSVIFTPALQVHRYPPAVWGDDEEEDDDDEWDVGGYEDEDSALAEEAALAEQERRDAGGESDDGMSWEEALPDASRARVLAAAEEQRRQQELLVQQQQQLQQQKEQQLLQQQQQQQQYQAQQEAEQQAVIQQQQRQQIEEQRRQQQILAQQMARQAAGADQGPAALSIRAPDSRERLGLPQDSASVSSTSPGSARSMDPADASETKKITMTPSVARDSPQRNEPSRQAQAQAEGPILPSEVMQRQEEERKRVREEIGSLEDARKKAKSPSSGPGGRPTNGPAKLRKEPQSGDEDSGREKDKKGKSGGLFGRLFDRRKDKHKEKGDSVDIGRGIERTSEESGRSSNHTDNSASTQQTAPRRGAGQEAPSPPVSLHTTSLRQRDREHQVLYQQQYLNRSPASPPEAQSTFVLSSPGTLQTNLPGTSATLSPSSDGRRPRPGSLVIGGGMSSDGASAVPELSVIRIFAGKKVQTEATFKTVLLNASTSSDELVKQAIQRFRLPAGEDATDYYLTVKQVEGSSAMLRSDEKPLLVFETLVEAALELPKVKRSSVGSISSIASNLSQHPAIKKLPMNDFTDDSAVKIYLNRRSDSGSEESAPAEDADAAATGGGAGGEDQGAAPLGRPQYLNSAGAAVSSERFSSPSFRFALKLVIYPDDLPDDMVFDPLTEAIVFKNTLRDRPQAAPSPAPFRRKIYLFPKNITVAEVIEFGLERFGIPDGVVDGGDEVEDKNTKRRSSSRVRYALNVQVDGKAAERELTPSSKVIDAYPRPPSYRPADRRFSDSKRRSVDSMQLIGSLEDISPDDPVFILRRAVTYRASSSRHRLSAPLDEIALQKLHRESVSSSSAASEDDTKQRHMSKQELIAAQRAATRANQLAIRAQSNSQRGVDVLLPNNAMLRSSRYEMDERTRYSYIEGGETYDISDIMEEEWDPSADTQGDLLEGVLARGGAKDGVDEKLHRVLNKIRDGRGVQRGPASPPVSASTIDSVYSTPGHDDAPPERYATSRTTTPVAEPRRVASPIAEPRRVASPIAEPRRVASPASERTVTPDARRQRSATPSSAAQQGKATPPPHLRQESVASVMSDTSGYRTAVGSPSPPPTASPALFKSAAGTAQQQMRAPSRAQKPKLALPKDDFGVGHMMAIIELAGLQETPAAPVHPVDEMLFGRPMVMEELHPAIREIYAPTFKQLESMDEVSDMLARLDVHATQACRADTRRILQHALATAS